MKLTQKQLPKDVVRYAKLWGAIFQITHPNWKAHNGYVLDEWRTRGDYDINLYCEGGYLSVCIYPQEVDDRGDIVTDCSQWVRVVRVTRKEKV